jgi:hypothetical protein
MAKVKAYVYSVPGLFGDDYRVYPPVIVLNQGDKFQLINTVDAYDADLTIPNGVFVSGAVNEHVNKKSGSVEQTAGSAIIGVQYKVKVNGKDATGNSDPVIIIDP